MPGQMFYVTQGQHINSEDFFAAWAKADHNLELSKLQKRKKDLLKQ